MLVISIRIEAGDTTPEVNLRLYISENEKQRQNQVTARVQGTLQTRRSRLVLRLLYKVGELDEK